MKLKTKKMLAFTMITLSVMAILGSISYAYFTAMGETNPQDASLTTGVMSLKFADNDAGINATLDFDESVTKKFTIENTGTVDALARINWVDLVNTYTLGSLTYTLSQSETVDGIYTEVLSKTNVPKTNVPAKKTLVDSLVIPTGKTYYYNLEITFNYLDDVNQNDDIDANLNTRFELVDMNSSTDVVIAFDAQEGETTEDSKVVSYNANNYGTLPTPTKKGYAFLGWFTEQDGGELIESTTELQKYSNHTLYAHWRKQTVVEQIIASSHGVRTEFATPATTDEGIFEMEDDYGTSYYYRGAVTNNYVKFANYYWRIIRVNGDGSLRIIYDGTRAHTNGESSADRFTHTSKAYNANYNDAKYVGWMYGPAGTAASTSKEQAQTNIANSDMKILVDSWYKTNIVDKGYGSAVADVIFCNDRSTASTPKVWWTSEETNIGYGTNKTAYGGFSRFITPSNSWSSTPNPKFMCPQKNDSFTVSDTTKGNGALTYPVGLITADEIVATGSGKGGTINKNYYLYKTSNYWYWSLSPFNQDYHTRIFIVHISGQLSGTGVQDATGAVAPVVNLSAVYASEMVGTGTMNDPYRAPNIAA